MTDYGYGSIKEVMKVGHEVDFIFKKKKCSLLNDVKGWAFWVEGKLILLEENLEIFLVTKCLDGLSARDILEEELYDENTLVIY